MQVHYWNESFLKVVNDKIFFNEKDESMNSDTGGHGLTYETCLLRFIPLRYIFFHFFFLESTDLKKRIRFQY